MAETQGDQAAGEVPFVDRDAPVAALNALYDADFEKNAADAEAACRRILQVRPEEPEALRMRGLARLYQGDAQDAVKDIERSLNADDQNLQTGIDLGRARRALGDVRGARAILAEVLHRRLESAEALARLAEIDFATNGDMDQAVTFLRRAVELEPEEPTWRNWFVRVLIEAGLPGAAVQHAHKVVEQRPDCAGAWRNLAGAMWLIGEMQTALEALKQAIRLEPEDDNARENVVRVLKDTNHLVVAEDFLERTIRDEYESARLYCTLGDVRVDRVDYEGAIEAFNEALRLAPENPRALAGLGLANSHLQRDAAADEALSRAVAHYPRHPGLLVNYAIHCAHTGRMDDARSYARRALEVQPDNVQAIMNLVTLEGKETPEDVRAQIMELEDSPKLTRREAAKLHYAKGNLLHHDKNYDGAFHEYSVGSALVYSQLDFKPEQIQRRTERLERTLGDWNEIKRVSENGYRDPAPIFVVGTPRSGTTLLEQVIASHPEAVGVGERREVGQLFDQKPDEHGIWAKGESYVRSVRYVAGDSPTRIVDKMPANFALVPFIHAMLPEARIIHIRRHPLDAMLSAYRQLFAEGQEWSYNFEAMAVFYESYRRLTARWRELMPADVFMEIDYEGLVTDFESEAARVLDFVGLSWDDRVTEFHRNAGMVRTASMSQVRQPLYKTAAGSWKKYEGHLEPLARKMHERGIILPDDVHEVFNLT